MSATSDAVAARPDPDAIGAQVAAIMVEGMRADR
jgi:hypothetical protein